MYMLLYKVYSPLSRNDVIQLHFHEYCLTKVYSSPKKSLTVKHYQEVFKEQVIILSPLSSTNLAFPSLVY